MKLVEGVEISEQEYQSESWEKPRRLIIIRQKVNERPTATGKTLKLFAEEEFYNQYRYSAYVTTLKLSGAEVWRIYRGRANAENQIKELKYDFGFESFNLKSFYGTEAALMFVMIAYNLMSLFRQFILQEKTQKRLATLRHRNFTIGAYFEKKNGEIILKIGLIKKRRKWFTSLWNQSRNFEYPFSNA